MAANSGEQTRTELMANPGLKDRMHFANECLQPAVGAGLIEMTIPDKPQSSKQNYRITAAGGTQVELHD
jgi:ATP-dependent DNA helicase RecG